MAANTERQLKIAMVLDAYDDARNGAVISTKRFSETLKKRHQVIIVSTGKAAPDKVVMPGIYVPWVSSMREMKAPIAFPLNGRLRPVIASVDLVHVHFPFMLNRQAVKIANRLHKPVVSTFHVQPEHVFYNMGVRWQKLVDAAYFFLVRQLYNRCDVVVCPSRFAQDTLMRYGLKAPSCIISNGIPAGFRPLKVRRPAEFGNHFVILSVGRLSVEKNQELIIRAIARSRHRHRIRLVLLGDGHLRKKLLAVGASLPVPPLITSVSPEEMVNYYNISDLCIHAAEVEVECMSVMEAIACGLPPVIARSPRSAASQFALDERSLFDYGNAGMLADKINYWIEHPAELRKASEAYLLLSKQYSFENSARKLEELYLRLTQ